MGQKNLTPDQRKQIEYYFEECYNADAQKKLGKSVAFLDSLQDYYDKNNFLTDKQRNALADLYERVTR